MAVVSPLFTNWRSADGAREVESSYRLLSGDGSWVGDATAATLVNVPVWPEGMLTMSSRPRGLPPVGEMLEMVQVTTRELPSKDPPSEADTNVTPAGRVSVTTTTEAAVGPALAMLNL